MEDPDELLHLVYGICSKILTTEFLFLFTNNVLDSQNVRILNREDNKSHDWHESVKMQCENNYYSVLGIAINIP